MHTVELGIKVRLRETAAAVRLPSGTELTEAWGLA